MDDSISLDGLEEYLLGLEEGERLRAMEYLELQALTVIARENDNPAGFAAFYRLVFGREIPALALGWVEDIYEAYEVKKGRVIEAFRGSTKTTTITIGFMAWRIGRDPHKTNVIIQLSDDMGADNAKAVAGIIERNPGFALVFPTVKPRPSEGWGASGYWVLDEGVDKGEWETKTAANKDPTLVGVGYKSAIIGMRPTGLMLVDDIHDRGNTESIKELRRTTETVTDVILPMAVEGETWQVFIGTPWVRNDTLDLMKRTGGFLTTRTPVYVYSDEGEEYEFAQGRVKLTWPEYFDLVTIESIRIKVSADGPFAFNRMYLLDIEKAGGIALKREWLRYYPADKIKHDFPTVLAVDYASALAEIEKGRQKRDYCAIGIFRYIDHLPALVLTGGVREVLTQGEAEMRVQTMAISVPNLMWIAIGTTGKGEEFYSLMYRSTKLPIKGVVENKVSKAKRHELETAPLFMTNRLFITDEPDQLVLQFINEWVGFPTYGHDDILDMVWIAAKSVFGLIAVPPKAAREVDGKPQKKNPFSSLGRN